MGKSSVMTYQVYRNLNNGSWSIRSSDSGLIVAHGQAVLLVNAEFKVSEAGRQRVIQEKRKNVHAHIEGEIELWDGEFFKSRTDIQDFLCDVTEEFSDRMLEHITPVEVSYNPYRLPHFFNKETLDKVTQAAYAFFTPNKKVYIGSAQ